MNPITIEVLKFTGEEGNSKVVGEDVTYVENEKGEKFGCQCDLEEDKTIIL